MEQIQELDFDRLEPQCEEKDCDHKDLVELHYCGMHSTYGCRKCKLKSLDLNCFKIEKIH